ncbi:TIR domain-containing protein [Rhodococcus sp. 14-2470-1a]|uniref:TIR domain-containing protein n=1 Tax=Rhodococcus sp. 14-2470-1a TaxID=2023150 RepID=UPI0015C62568|nr:TIR domain-containing protein [Rhodococcus sp. 14-2470-1a]
MADDVKIFISWSGDLSREITKVLRLWLPKMFDRVQPWMSDIDVAAGSRALKDIEDQLNGSDFGIIVVTTENQDKPWLNFEAGALSKRFDNSLSLVVPVLVNFNDFFEIGGPIRQFQGVMLQKQNEPYKEGVRKLLQSISAVASTDWSAVEARFEWSWEEFVADVEAAKSRVEQQPEPPKFDKDDALREILYRMDRMERVQAVPSSSASRTADDDDDYARAQSLINRDRKLVHHALQKSGINHTKIRIVLIDDKEVAIVSVLTLPEKSAAAQAASRVRAATGMGLRFQLADKNDISNLVTL